jgi:protein O-GlcNAc transferase
LVLARRPAPVQVTWLGYPGTTGLSAIDYRLSDPHLDPDASQDHVYAERTIRLPHSFWCYAPIATTPEINELPAVAAGQFTFGSFNNFCKVTPQALQLWAQTLRAIPFARMLIQCQPGSHRQHVLQQMSDQGVAPDRIEFVGLMRDDDYFKLYHRVDACLDPIPDPGHTTSLDSLWMGVPMVTLAGRTAVSRGGASILRNIGLPELVANSADEYIEVASRLAGDLSRLQSLRRNLRQMLQSSPLMNAKQFASDMENIFRQMWRNHCQTSQAKAA